MNKFLLLTLSFAHAAISNEYQGRSFPDDYQVRSFAADYRVHCFSTFNKCSDKLGQLLTEKFKTHYDRKKFQVVVYSQFHKYSDGGGVGIAFSGVSPILANQRGVQFPQIQYTTSMRSSGTYINDLDAKKGMEKLAIDAVKRMMDECENRLTCDVYQAYD